MKHKLLSLDGDECIQLKHLKSLFTPEAYTAFQRWRAINGKEGFATTDDGAYEIRIPAKDINQFMQNEK